MFEEFLDVMRLNRRKSPWMRERSFHDIVDELEQEVHELRAESDEQKIREELGDVLMDTLSLVAIAEDEGWFTADELVSGAMEKFKRRKPWVFEEHDLTEEEEVRLWNAAKGKE